MQLQHKHLQISLNLEVSPGSIEIEVNAAIHSTIFSRRISAVGLIDLLKRAPTLCWCSFATLGFSGSPRLFLMSLVLLVFGVLLFSNLNFHSPYSISLTCLPNVRLTEYELFRLRLMEYELLSCVTL